MCWHQILWLQQQHQHHKIWQFLILLGSGGVGGKWCQYAKRCHQCYFLGIVSPQPRCCSTTSQVLPALCNRDQAAGWHRWGTQQSCWCQACAVFINISFRWKPRIFPELYNYCMAKLKTVLLGTAVVVARPCDMCECGVFIFNLGHDQNLKQN